jgi:SSS family solute:Na+ symporter
LAAILALYLSNALEAFNILLQIGAGTGLIFILRWFWWRINAYTEISAMVISFIVAVYFESIHNKLGFLPIPPEMGYLKLLIGVSITTVTWILVTLFTKPEDDKVLLAFYQKVRPASWGWKSLLDRYPEQKAEQGQLPMEIGLMLIGSIMVYAALFATGFWIYGNILGGTIATIVAISGAILIVRSWNKMK